MCLFPVHVISPSGTIISSQKKVLRSSHRRCFVKKGVYRNFAKFTGKHLCQRLFFNKVAGLSQNSQENTCARVSFLIKLQAWDSRRLLLSTAKDKIYTNGSPKFGNTLVVHSDTIMIFKNFDLALCGGPVRLQGLGSLICHSQPAFTCSNLTTETLEQGVKYVQS